MVGMMDTGMNGVERISHYTHSIPQEKQTTKDLAEEDTIPENWPSRGLIVAEDAVIPRRPVFYLILVCKTVHSYIHNRR